ncbi:MAG: nickel pincer cofactor biosynthesis protein LarC, partial [Nannocystaceae bacterium]
MSEARVDASCIVLDPAGGLAGDMFLGMLLDLGADPQGLEAALRSLDLPDWSMEVSQVVRREVGATRVLFTVPHEHSHRHLPEIEGKIDASSMSSHAKGLAVRTFRALAKAEAAVHRIPMEQVHFHEVGAADSILDICGACIALDSLGITTVRCGPLPAGSGVVRCDHGELPVPVPAVLELAAGRFELVMGQGEGEMVTPTGMSLVAALGAPIDPGARFVPQRVGYGAGTRATSVLRGVLGNLIGAGGGLSEGASGDEGNRGIKTEAVALLRTNVDDATGEELAFAMTLIMEEGALDVTATPCIMKKGRPATVVEVMCEEGDEARMAEVLMKATGSLGVRVTRTDRFVMP